MINGSTVKFGWHKYLSRLKLSDIQPLINRLINGSTADASAVRQRANGERKKCPVLTWLVLGCPNPLRQMALRKGKNARLHLSVSPA